MNTPHIHSTPGTCGGRPRIPRTRFSISRLLGLLAGGSTVDEIAEDYTVSKPQILNALADLSDGIDKLAEEAQAHRDSLIKGFGNQ